MTVEPQEWLGREIRTENPEELATSSYELLKRAVASGNRAEARRLLHYLNVEERDRHHQTYALISAWMTLIAGRFGEDEVYRSFRARNVYMTPEFLRIAPRLSQREYIQYFAELKRRQRSGTDGWGDLAVTETHEKLAISCDPCGTGGWLMRLEEEYGSQEYLGRTSEPKAWSFGRANVPYYCSHCCIGGEHVPTEMFGCPSVVTDCPSEAPELPCVQTWYKSPAAIPDVYFERIGAKRPVT